MDFHKFKQKQITSKISILGRLSLLTYSIVIGIKVARRVMKREERKIKDSIGRKEVLTDDNDRA